MFERVAGYALTVDPAAYRGMAVAKSEINGAHDGRLVACPRTAEPGVAYQRFIDSSDGVTAVDYRTIVIDRRPRFVLVKTKPAASRFSIHNTRVEYREIEDVFSAAERALIAAFAEAMLIDWAALDILRDRQDGQLYVVDVNKTDTGPPVDLSAADREKLKKQIAAGFHDLLLKAQLSAGLLAQDTAA
jgi:hypothetical protein